MAKSKDKGNSWERDFAEYLTKLFGKNYKRNVNGSGAFMGSGNVARKLSGRDTSQVLSLLGDIVPPTRHYVVSECKNYNEFPFHNLFNKATIIWDWLEEVRFDARFDDSSPDVQLPHWLAVKVTRQGSYLLLPDKFFGQIFKEDSPVDFPYHVYQYVKKNENKEVYFREPYYMVALEFLHLIKDQLESVVSDDKYFVDDVSNLVSTLK
jgi:hypothetical protein